jgi:hypothetical protein
MRLAINQPYFFPYIGYFSLIKNSDQFILLDVVQFVRQGWMRRNRILKQDNGWQYISVPVNDCSRETLIKDISICNNNNWKQVLLNQLQYYRKLAPYYTPVTDLLNNIFKGDFTDIVHLNKKTLEGICEYLEIDFQIKVLSEMDLQLEKAGAPDEWALNICKAIGDVNEYWNLPGGSGFYDTAKYYNAGLDIKFLKNIAKPYDQKREKFEPDLSIIDVMMFNDKSKIRDMIDEFEFI